MVLSDGEIIEEILSGNLLITPLFNGKEQIGSSSIDVRLGTEFRYIKTSKQTHFDLNQPLTKIREQIERYSEVVHINPLQPFILHPNDFVLASTLEYIIIPPHLTARLEGRSTWGRVGLQVHSTAGFVDPGFEGSLTFELHNMGKLALPLYPGIRVGQLSFHRIKNAKKLYVEKESSKYAKETGTKSSMFFEDYDYKMILTKKNRMSMMSSNLSNAQINTILNEDLDENFWFYNLGANSDENLKTTDNDFSVDFYNYGKQIWQKYHPKLKSVLCDEKEGKPKESIHQIISGDIRETITALVSLLSSTYSISLSIAIPLVALCLKKGIATLCKG